MAELLTDVYTPARPEPWLIERPLLRSRPRTRRCARRWSATSASSVIGEDVAGGAGRAAQGFIDAWGGPMGATKGLIQQFGPSA